MKDARKRARQLQGTIAVPPAKKKAKPKPPPPPPKRGAPERLHGQLRMGHKSILLNREQQCLDYFENETPELSEIKGGRYVFQSGQHRLVSLERKRQPPKVVGTRGHCKAYIQTSKKDGIIIFHERSMVRITNVVWQELVKRDLAPPGYLKTIDLAFDVLDCKKKWKKRLETTSCIAVKHINFPTFLFDLQNDDHCKVLYAEKTFHTPEELSGSKYWSGAIDDLIAKYAFMYKKNLFKGHPKFTSEEYERFCDKITNLLGEEPNLKLARPSKMKWGNVLYCMDAKKWYWVDC